MDSLSLYVLQSHFSFDYYPNLFVYVGVCFSLETALIGLKMRCPMIVTLLQSLGNSWNKFP